MTPRRELTAALLSSVAAAGVGLFAVTRTWGVETVARPYPLPAETVTTVGTSVAPWALPAGIVALAAGLALVATGGRARGVVLCILAACGVVAAVSGGVGVVGLVGVWPVVTVLSGAAVAVVAVWSWFRHRDWPRMSARYERNETDTETPVVSDGEPVDATRLWDALGRGDDPTR